MLNYKKLYNKFNKALLFNESFESFQETVRLAEEQQAGLYIKSIFPDKEDMKNALDNAHKDIKVMTWNEIYNLAADYEVGVDINLKTEQENKVNWRHQEELRMLKKGF